ncbi:MurR/RpiR family transcriptional regulator [Ornithinicoccus halotolerans]|uniref:MurR/RpiR family transcriptional regulator n=1 Tax=Ornithinicoccus halotolerans TaxID=1748220 RepID=UPI00129709B0|nr:MurR/RpiR family transcriptional regulator [Ornithinicoccus halotolerans]
MTSGDDAVDELRDQVLPGWLTARLGDRRPAAGARRVLSAIATQPRQMSYASTSAAATAAEVNVATVVRTAQQLGFSGWPALRAEIRSPYLSGLSASEVLSEHDEEAEQGPAWSTLRRDLHNLQDLARLLDEDQVERVARIIHGAPKTLVLGSGSFAAPGLQLSHLAQTIGHDVRLQRVGGTSLFNAVSLLGPHDCLVVFQLWRTPHEIRHAMQVAAAAGASVVLVSDQVRADLVEVADELVAMPSEGASMFPSLVAAITVVQSVIAALVACDPAAAAGWSDRVEGVWSRYGLFPDPGEDLQ